jgi:hypothetical protein
MVKLTNVVAADPNTLKFFYWNTHNGVKNDMKKSDEITSFSKGHK